MSLSKFYRAKEDRQSNDQSQRNFMGTVLEKIKSFAKSIKEICKNIFLNTNNPDSYEDL